MTKVDHKRALFVAAIRTTKKPRSKTWNQVYCWGETLLMLYFLKLRLGPCNPNEDINYPPIGKIACVWHLQIHARNVHHAVNDLSCTIWKSKMLLKMSQLLLKYHHLRLNFCIHCVQNFLKLLDEIMPWTRSHWHCCNHMSISTVLPYWSNSGNVKP